MRALAVITLAGALAVTSVGCADDPPPPFEFFDACAPDQVPDATCYASKRDPGSDNVALASAIAARYMAEHPATEETWGWEDGVLMYAMTELYRVTGDQAVHNYYRDYMDHQIDEGYGISLSDSCPPALTAIALYAETGEQKYRDVIDEVMLYLFELATRNEQGGINHLGGLAHVTLWVDSLFMFGMVLTRWGEVDDNREALDEMGNQLSIFSDLLQDKPTGLFVHAYNWWDPQDPDVYWARGNSWITTSAADYLRARSLRHEDDPRAAEILASHTTGALADQDESGGWWTVMNRPGETYLETSATALFGYGLARAYRYGLAGEDVRPPLAQAVDYVKSQIVNDTMGRPVVTNISGPTMAGDFQNYADVPLEDDLSYGVGAAILVLIESSGLP